MDRIAILDFGSQYTQLIARRLREMSVYSEIFSPDTPPSQLKDIKGLILSGSPASIGGHEFAFDRSLLNLPFPILGICYGMHLLCTLYGGAVRPFAKKEFGKQDISLGPPDSLFKDFKKQETVWMSHGDSIDTLPSQMEPIALSESGLIAAVRDKSEPRYGVQFHPEVTHTPSGKTLLHNFVSLCQCKRDWTVEHILDLSIQEIQSHAKNRPVVSLVSGGVGSTVSTFLCLKALGPDQVIPIHIDTGLMRHKESEEITCALEEAGMSRLVFIDAKERFLSALKGVSDPEEKRHIIGDLFIEIIEGEIRKLGETTAICQGTLYTDLIESGKGGAHAALIKSHHNVNPPILEKKRKEGLLIEPNARIFKDEVRRVAEALKVPDSLIRRHPFPGPGLAIRILGEITPERLSLLRSADRIYLEEIQKEGLYDKIWQAFAVLLPVSAVGVAGDKRLEGNVLALRAISSVDGMTADVFPLSTDLLSRIASRIINETHGIARVTYDITSKPPGTIEWE